jgi:hypothetical protein
LLIAAGVSADGLAGTPEAARPVELTGELEVVVIDDEAAGRAETHYYLRDPAGGRALPLDLKEPPPGDWVTGDRVTVKGVLEGGRIRVHEIRGAADGR